MNIRDLQYLVTAAELKHFGKAAEANFVSQPTLSTQLKKLENELGTPIFERNNKQILLTPAGKLIVDQAKIILRDVKTLKETAQRYHNPFAGPIKIGIIPTIAPYLLPRIMSELATNLPDTEFFLYEEKTDQLLEKIRSGEYDAVILALPVPCEGLAHKSLYQEAFQIALNNNHHLAKAPSLHISDLTGETLLLLEEGHCFRDQALEVCSQTKLEEKPDYKATSLETLRFMVAAGMGITLLPELANDASAKHQALATINFKTPVPHRDIAMLWRKMSPKAQCCDKISDLITSIITPLLKQ